MTATAASASFASSDEKAPTDGRDLGSSPFGRAGLASRRRIWPPPVPSPLAAARVTIARRRHARSVASDLRRRCARTTPTRPPSRVVARVVSGVVSGARRAAVAPPTWKDARAGPRDASSAARGGDRCSPSGSIATRSRASPRRAIRTPRGGCRGEPQGADSAPDGPLAERRPSRVMTWSRREGVTASRRVSNDEPNLATLPARSDAH